MRKSIAVIGAGIAGMGAAWALSRRHDVTLFEKDARPGGHSNTVTVDYDGARIAVDTGFIVYNTVNYPNLVRLFEKLGVKTEESNMSFSVSMDSGRLEWAGDSIGKLFAQKRNILKPGFHGMWLDILRFNKRALLDLNRGALDAYSLGEYLDLHGFGRRFREHYLLPMGAAIWSTSAGDMLGFPARSFVEFFDNHALLQGFNTHSWRTVSGGSQCYVEKLIADFRGRLVCDAQLRAVSRSGAGVALHFSDGAIQAFDEVVFACHPDQALAMLTQARADEREILSAMRYAPNRAILHRDARLMPRRRKVWSSWNYLGEHAASGAPVSLTYWMNRLQNIDPARPLFVSLNPSELPRADLIFGSFQYEHPQFDRAALAARVKLAAIQGAGGVWYCGAWCGHGFHEDGLTSGLEVAERLGAEMPFGRIAAPRIFAEAKAA